MRKWLLLTFLVLLILAPLSLLGVLVYTERGVQLLEPRLAGLHKFGVHIEGVSGTLAGPLKVSHFELKHPAVHIEAFDIEIRVQPLQLIWQTLRVSSLTARDVLVEMRPSSEPPSTRPLRFTPAFLRITVDGEVHGVRYVNANGTVIEGDRVAADVVLTSSRIRVPRFQVNGPLFNATGNLRLKAQRPLGLTLATQGQLYASRNLTLGLNAQLDGTLDDLGMKVQVVEPSSVLADVKLTRPQNSWRIAGKLSSPQFSLTPWLKEPPFTLRNIQLDLDAGPRVVRLAGSVLVPELDSRAVRVKADGNYAARVLTFNDAELALADLPARAHVAGTIQFTQSEQILDLRTAWSDVQWPLRSSALLTSRAGSGTLRGPLPYDFTVSGQFAGPNVPASQGTGQGVLSKEQVNFENYQIDTLNGAIKGRASLQFAAPRAWSLQAAATKLNPASLDAEFPGSLSFNLEGTGSGLDQRANFNVRVNSLQGNLRGQPVRGSGQVERTQQSWRLQDVRLTYGSAQLAANGKLDGTWQNKSRARVDARWSLQATQLQQLWPDAHGSIDFNGSAVGPLTRPHVTTTLQATEAGYREWRAQRVAVDADIDPARDTRSRLQAEAKGIRSSQPIVDSMVITGSGTAAQHAIDFQLSGHATTTEPAASVRLQITASYLNELWNATINSSQLTKTLGYARLELAEPAHAVVGKDRMSLDNLCFVVGAGRLCGTGKWQRGGPWESAISGYEIPVATLLPPAGDEAEYGGRVEGRVRAFGTAGAPWQAEAGMRIVDAAIVYRPKGAEPQTLNLGTGGIAATATNEQVNFSLGLQAFTDTFIYANARIQRNGSNDLLHLPLHGDIRARAADANILPIIVSDIDHAAGLLTAKLDVNGTLAAPQIDGRIGLENGELDSYRINLALRNLNLAAQLSGSRVSFNGAGLAGEGTLQADGAFAWQDGVSRGELRLKGENLLVADLPEYRLVASPDLLFKIDGRRIDASGEVKVPSARIAPAQLKGAVQVSPDARYLGEHQAEREGRLQLNSEIRITMGNDVRVDSFGLQGAMSGSVATSIATGRTATGRGELRVLDGRYEAYGQKLAINRGRLLFEAAPLDDPGLDIEARRKIEAVEVGLNVRGTLQSPRLSFFSDPPMPQSQIVAYLVVGKPLDEMQGGDRSTVSSARDTLTSQGGGFLASRLGRRLGLEEVGVENNVDSAGANNTSLVLGKFLSPRLFISYGISLTESINTLKLRYTISDRFILKTEAGENQSADVEFTLER